MTDLTNPIFNDETAARAHFEKIRWPNGPVCPHCGTENEVTLVNGKSHRPGMYQCNACREPFTVTIGTVMERSHIPIHKWVLAFHLMASAKKGISAHQLHRTLGITYKSAWFMAHRIREAMALPANPPRLGGKGKIVEADETFIGKASGKKKHPGSGGYAHKIAVFSLVERGGKVRSKVIERAARSEIAPVLREHLHPKSELHTDGAMHYRFTPEAASHKAVDHNKQYARKDGRIIVHTNSAEAHFSVFKRGMFGTYQHCGEQHLQRYLAEFDFRYSNRAKLGVNDVMRAERAMRGAEGKRLTYHQASR